MKNNFNVKQIVVYIGVVIAFSVVALIYFNPVLKGEKIKQSDITQFRGMSKEIEDYRAVNDKEPYWIGNAFGGMPSYQVSTYYPNDLARYLDKCFRFLPRPADYLFLYLVGFFFLLRTLKIDWRLAVLGSLSFGFSTYLIIIFGAGHNAKAHAIGYMPFVLAGVLYVFQKKYLWGFIITAIAMALEIYTNHPQMTYYLGFCMLILGIVHLVDSIKNKTVPVFCKQVAILLVAIGIGLSVNSARLFSMKEYADYSTRGKSELTINPDGTKKEISSGLDKEYITQYSYGIWETFNLIIPRFTGGGTVEKLGEDSNFYQILESKAGKKVAKENSEQVFTYWGTQPGVEAPAYIGAVMFFLFILGIYLVKGRLKYWLVSTTIFAVVLSWGKNFGFITNLFIDYVPLYSKFRAVSSIQVLAELSVPLLGVIALREFFSSKISSEEKEKALKKAFYIIGGMCLFFMLFGTSLFDFIGLRDRSYQQLPALIEALISDRKAMLFNDSLRSFILVLLSAGLLWFLLKNKIKETPVIIALGVLILFDLIAVDIRYVNKEDFVKSKKVTKPFTATKADKQILQDKTHYRVANFSGNFMNDGATSYYHKSIGGYHAAKPRRYQELIEYQLSKNNMEVVNMLNTKYFIVPSKEGLLEAQTNPDANGNAWFINNMIGVDNANDEIFALSDFDSKKDVVVNTKEFDVNVNQIDITASIQLISYEPNELVYDYQSEKPQTVVFSEMYYQPGWNAYIDGNITPHFRANYVLRAMNVNSGKHKIVFKFEPKVIQQGSIVSLVGYGLLIIIAVIIFFVSSKKETKKAL